MTISGSAISSTAISSIRMYAAGGTVVTADIEETSVSGDVVTATVIAPATLAESSAGTDALQASVVAPASLGEASVPGDIITATITAPAMLAEVSTPGDSLSAVISVGADLSESSAATDTLSATIVPTADGRSNWLRYQLIQYYEQKFARKKGPDGVLQAPKIRRVKTPRQGVPKQPDPQLERVEGTVRNLFVANEQLSSELARQAEVTNFVSNLTFSSLQFARLVENLEQFGAHREKERQEQDDDDLMLLSMLV